MDLIHIYILPIFINLLTSLRPMLIFGGFRLIFVVNCNGSDNLPPKMAVLSFTHPYVFSNCIFHLLDIKCHLASFVWPTVLKLPLMSCAARQNSWKRIAVIKDVLPLHVYRETGNIFCCIFWLIEFLSYLWSSNSRICIWGMCLYSTTRSAETVKMLSLPMYKHDNLGRKIYLKDYFLWVNQLIM